MNMHYSAINNDMFRPYKWAIIRLLVEPMGRLYTRSSGGRTRSRLTLSCGVLGNIWLNPTGMTHLKIIVGNYWYLVQRHTKAVLLGQTVGNSFLALRNENCSGESTLSLWCGNLLWKLWGLWAEGWWGEGVCSRCVDRNCWSAQGCKDRGQNFRITIVK